MYHGTSFKIEGKGILLRGKPGAGKSDLALRMIHRGAILIADDQTIIENSMEGLMMSPPQGLQGKLEVRGIGLIDVPFCKNHLLHFLIDLKPWQNIERLPEKDFETLEGLSIPRYEIDPFEPSAVEKILTLCQLNTLSI